MNGIEMEGMGKHQEGERQRGTRRKIPGPLSQVGGSLLCATLALSLLQTPDVRRCGLRSEPAACRSLGAPRGQRGPRPGRAEGIR